MGAVFQSIDAMLNLSWVLLSVAVLLFSWRRQRVWQHKNALLAILFILVLLFPVISTADDMAEQALMSELAPSPLSAKSAKEIKQSITSAVLTAQAILSSLQPPLEWRSEQVQSKPVSGFAPLLGSASGIHSPPRF